MELGGAGRGVPATLEPFPVISLASAIDNYLMAVRKSVEGQPPVVEVGLANIKESSIVVQN